MALALWGQRAFFKQRAFGISRRRLFLAVLLVLSFLNYSRVFSFSNGLNFGALKYIWSTRVDSYDLIHYYLTPKYFSELEYFHLYPSAIVADLENGGPFFTLYPNRTQIVFQNEDDYYWQDAEKFFTDRGEHERTKSRFTPNRWEAFSHDFIYLQRVAPGGLGRRAWNDMLWDHGFNGTPAWVGLVHKPLQLVPVEQVKKLGYVDLLWLVGGAAAALWAFGIDSCFFLLIFLFTSYSTRWPTFTWAFGRYDYVGALLIAVSLLKKNFTFLSGIFAGVAASFRIFPGLWLLGIIARLPQSRKKDWKPLSICMGFGIGCALLWSSALYQFGASPIENYLKKMKAHTSPENLSSMRQGFALALAYRGEFSIDRMDPERRLQVKSDGVWRMPLALLLTALLYYYLRKKPLYESFAYGFVPFFLLTTASYYYYVVRAPLIVIHSESASVRHRLSLAFLFLIDAVSNALQTIFPKVRVAHIGWMGWLCTAYVMLTLFLLNREEKRGASITS